MMASCARWREKSPQRYCSTQIFQAMIVFLDRFISFVYLFAKNRSLSPSKNTVLY